MARNSAEESWGHSESSQEEEEEALSFSDLCDLPDKLIEEERQLGKGGAPENDTNQKDSDLETWVDTLTTKLSVCDLTAYLKKEENQSSEAGGQAKETKQEDFEFGAYGGCLSTESEMCAADDVFFQGQILPLRLSVSSESGLNKLKNDSLNPSRCASRSESMDHGSLGGLTGFSSRSSSIGSHYSSSSTGSSSTRISKPRIQNQFQTQSSPRPQIRLPSGSLRNTSRNMNRKSSPWGYLRLSLFHTPAIELEDLKVRTSVSRNSSCSSSISNSNLKINGSKTTLSGSSSKIDDNQGNNNMEKQRIQRLLEKKPALFNGCSCSVSAVSVKAGPLNTKANNGTGNDNDEKSERRAAIDEKLRELKRQMAQKKKQGKQKGKQALSRHRTLEWIKKL